MLTFLLIKHAASTSIVSKNYFRNVIMTTEESRVVEKLPPLKGEMSPYRALTHPSYTLQNNQHILPPAEVFQVSLDTSS